MDVLRHLPSRNPLDQAEELGRPSRVAEGPDARDRRDETFAERLAPRAKLLVPRDRLPRHDARLLVATLVVEERCQPRGVLPTFLDVDGDPDLGDDVEDATRLDEIATVQMNEGADGTQHRERPPRLVG